MNIKKLIVGSMFSMLLVSEMAVADWGDTYYCNMTSFLEVTVEGEMRPPKLETFKFTLDQARNSMVFGKTFFLNSVFELIDDSSSPSSELWHSGTPNWAFHFEDGKAFYSENGMTGLTALSWGCGLN